MKFKNKEAVMNYPTPILCSEWDDLMDKSIARAGNILYLKAERLRESGVIICPEQGQIFRALNLTPPDKVKVCIIGQDPYHTPGAANGLAFSVNPGHRIQPSLRNIFKELQSDIGCDAPESGDLTAWAERGVLLLNTSLTVTAGEPNSHKDWKWDAFTGHIFDICLFKLPQPVVFILWGKNAQELAENVPWQCYPNKEVIMSPHPSPMSARRGFFGSRPFSRTNEFLTAHGVEPVDWKL